jgi:tetratricopeptide (TPR) repeat protein
MRHPKIKPSELEKMLGEASWLLSHAQALADYGRQEEAAAEIARAANCEEQAAYRLDAIGREQEAVIHRVSAASCYEQLGQYARAVTLLRAALSRTHSDDYRGQIERQLDHCLNKVRKPLRRASSQTAAQAHRIAAS